MSEIFKPVRVAVNVMRARLTVIGFNIAIVSFQLPQLYGQSGGIELPGMDHAVHVTANAALLMALALSFCALVTFIISGSLDEVGFCTHWSLVAGDLLMYLGLAHTVAGFFAPLGISINIFATNLSRSASEISILHAALSVTGGAAWFLAIYVGPAVSLVRSPFDRRINIILGIAYLLLVLVLAWVTLQAVRIEEMGLDHPPNWIVGMLRELVQPLRW